MKFPRLPLLIIVTGLFVVIVFRTRHDPIWIALAAIGTIGAVIWAVYHQGILGYINRPILEIGSPGYSTGYLRWAQLLRTDSEGRLVRTDIQRYYVDVELQNTGKSIAKNCQPLLTKVLERNDADQWQEQPQWVPMSLRWILDEYRMQATGMPTEEKNIVPRRPYIFTLGHVTQATHETRAREDWHLEDFHFETNLIPTGQSDRCPAGEYCFVITVFSEQTTTRSKYFHVNWPGEQTTSFEEFRRKISVRVFDELPL